LSTYFVDTSSLAKRYIREVGSAWVISWSHPSAGHVIVLAHLTSVEMFSLLARRQREGTLAAATVATLQNQFLLHAEKEYLIYPQDNAVVAHARSLITKYPLRALDAIQLASAREASNALSEPMIFVSADNNLLAAAAGESFTTDNPLAHP
jgi:predicted nucleic acid-binding protein